LIDAVQWICRDESGKTPALTLLEKTDGQRGIR
jgi:hypothetical protein